MCAPRPPRAGERKKRNRELHAAHGNTTWGVVCHTERITDFGQWMCCVSVLLRRALPNEVVDYILLSHKFALLELPEVLCQFETRTVPRDLNYDDTSSDSTPDEDQPLSVPLWLERARARRTMRFVCNGYRICY